MVTPKRYITQTISNTVVGGAGELHATRDLGLKTMTNSTRICMVTVPVKCYVRALFRQNKCNVTSCQTLFVKLAYFFLFGAIGCDMIPPETLLEMLISVCYSEGIITDLYFSDESILCYWPEIVSELDFFKL